MQVIIRNNTVVATHPDYVVVPNAAYPGAEIVLIPGPEGSLSPGDPFDPKERPVASKEAEARILRDKLLAGSDWTQLGDAPLSVALKAEWVNYRQALRDLDLQAEKILWPTPPASSGRQA
jgi:hypothetical protein